MLSETQRRLHYINLSLVPLLGDGGGNLKLTGCIQHEISACARAFEQLETQEKDR